ncbi:MAG: hypothetical protein IPJ84_09130 [Bdellovibrionales bacterium]|nr:hypothetical protein [Bdellovibrionales bacterium]
MLSARGESLVLAGGLPTLTEKQLKLQIAVNALNSMLGNDGKTIDHDSATFETLSGSAQELAQLIDDMNAGKVKTLIIDGLNLGYVLPVDSGFRDALKKVSTVVYTGDRNDETGALAHWVLPAGSTMESWSDFELQSGVVSIQQPTIMPLYQTRSLGELLFAWTQKAGGAKAAATWLDYVKGVWKTQQSRFDLGKGKSFDEFWLEVLQIGVVANAGRRDRSGSARAFVGNLSVKPTKAEGVELVLYPSVQLLDGKYSNVAWLQSFQILFRKSSGTTSWLSAPRWRAKRVIKKAMSLKSKRATLRLKLRS